MDNHTHQWDAWISYDPMAFEMGITNGFRYRRECLVIGCSAIEQAENLIPDGKTETILFGDDK